ncbi:MAG: calcium/sodium antiporter [Candidatus Puniceispirillum sp. TMED176]|nr:MAG: calcium/sodium antiporter [Candidatus Puniceispirillum sp. TMED176]
MMIAINLLAGLGLLFLGGHYLVQHAVLLAGKLGVTPLVIGMTIVAFGTSAPELVVSLGAILTAHDDIVIGNIVGGNIVNILLVLSLSVLIFPIVVPRNFTRREGVSVIAATLLFMALCLDGTVSFLDGLILLVGLGSFIAATVLLFPNAERQTPEDQESDRHEEVVVGTGIRRHILWIVGALAALAIGSQLFVDGAVDLSRLLGVSEAVIGLTVVAVGTAAPEIVTATIAAWRRQSGVAIGNVLGSNMFNMLGIGGITALVSPIAVHPHFLRIDFVVLLAATIGVVVIGYGARSLGRVTGGLMLAAYAGYTASLF